MSIPALTALALGPALATAIFIYFRDRHEREPLRLLTLAFFYGAVSTVVTYYISVPFNALIKTDLRDPYSLFFDAFFKVALVEEFSKFLFVRFFLFGNKNFNEPFDGIVYAVMVSMGFASVENVLYVSEYGFVTGLLRMFTAVPAHAVFGILMGYFAGQAKFSGRSLYHSALALAAPALLHGLYDYFLFLGEVEGVFRWIWILSFVSLGAGAYLSRRAIRVHQEASPFSGDVNR